ncbi:MAG: hypothetical protein KAZ36_06805 [Bacteroidales bacterium]|nr:hypothetical protein [Bacteroidales bacterium]
MNFKERTIKAMELLKNQPPVTFEMAKAQILKRQERAKKENSIKKRSRIDFTLM